MSNRKFSLSIVLFIVLVTGSPTEGGDDDDYYDDQEGEDGYSDFEDTDEEDESSESSEQLIRVVKECFPGGMPPMLPPPPDFPEYGPYKKSQKVKKSKSSSVKKMAFLAQHAPSCREFEDAVVKETQAMLKKEGKPCKNRQNPSKCRWRYMKMARSNVEDPGEKCMMQMKNIYMM